nr:chemotaxis response regulator protein-glutamate methylesterase [Desulfobulbaceae bacterium]
MEPLRILVVDDSAFSRKIIKDALSPLAEVEIVGMVSNGADALLRVAAVLPDIVTLDVEMPGMNGLEVLSALQETGFAGAVVMLSSHTERGAPFTIKALELGAFDFMLKPSFASIEENFTALRETFLPIAQAVAQRKKINHLLRGGGLSLGHRRPEVAQASRSDSFIGGYKGKAPSQIITIGVSTGGPKALAQIIPKLTAALAVPVVIIQHMPQGFTEEFAKSLNAKSSITVKEAEDGELLLPGTVYVAPGGKQLKVTTRVLDKIFQITDDQPENNCKPSVDYFFRSVAQVYGSRATAVVLTGMGRDGAKGAQLMKSRGAKVIVQDEETSVVFGMPQAVIDLGSADIVSPLQEIANLMCQNLID